MNKALAASLAFFSLALVACDDGADDPARIRDLLSGNTLRGRTEKGETYYVYVGPAGTAHMWIELTGFADQGKWHIDKDSRFCTLWAMVRHGEETCFQVRRDEDAILFVEGEQALELILLTGNYQNLPRLPEPEPDQPDPDQNRCAQDYVRQDCFK